MTRTPRGCPTTSKGSAHPDQTRNKEGQLDELDVLLPPDSEEMRVIKRALKTFDPDRLALATMIASPLPMSGWSPQSWQFRFRPL
jgi:hypothetical protein